MKRTLAFIISVIMLFTLIPASSLAEGTKECVCAEPEIGEWFYWMTGPGSEWDCTNPNQTLNRSGYCKCGGYYKETVRTQPSHNLVTLEAYDENGKLIVDSEGEPNYLAPTCEENGYIKQQCVYCSKIIKETIAAPGHTYGEPVIYIKCFTPSDNEEDKDKVSAQSYGISRRYCTIPGCNAYKEERSVGHTYYVKEEKPATCFEEGYTAYKYCATCSTESYSVPIEKLTHIDENNDGYCDLCVSAYRGDGVFCSCVCHSENAFMKLIMPIIKLVWQLLGIDNCHGDCEAVHYEK